MRSSAATDSATAEPGVRGYLERLMGWQRQADAVAVAAVPADGAIAGALADPVLIHRLPTTGAPVHMAMLTSIDELQRERAQS